MAKKPAAPPQGAAPATVTARVLRACQYGQPDAIVELPALEAAAAQADGSVDTTPAAVAYAQSLQG